MYENFPIFTFDVNSCRGRAFIFSLAVHTNHFFPGADNTEPVFQIMVDLPSLERGRRVKKTDCASFLA